MKAAEQLPSGNTSVHKVTSPEACYRCGLTNHKTSDCHFKEATCRGCGKKRHIQRACKSGKTITMKSSRKKGPRGRERTKWVKRIRVVKTLIGVWVYTWSENHRLNLYMWTYESMVNHFRWRWTQVLPFLVLKQVLLRMKTTVVLRTYTSEVIPVWRELTHSDSEVQVMVTYGKQKKKLTLYVRRQKGPCLLGREWLTSIRLDWKMISLAAMDANQT